MTALHSQLQEIVDELDAISKDVRRLGILLAEHQFATRLREGKWSAAECLLHLSLTTRAFLPLIDVALLKETNRAVPATHRYEKDFLGRMMCWLMEPPYRTKMKTAAKFEPLRSPRKTEVIEEFDSFQRKLVERVEKAGGRDLNGIRVVSPFDARLSYNLYSGFKLLAAHQRRHLWQARRNIV